MISSHFNFQIISLDSINSTNIYALELIRQQKVQEGTVIWSRFQEKGKGQYERTWHSSPYKNLTFSLVIQPGLDVNKQFLLSQKVALAISNSMDRLSGIQTNIKWPNDILINHKKIGGVLIENIIQGNKISQSVIGVGINVNESIFPTFQREATSLLLTTGRTFIIEELLHTFLFSIKEELNDLSSVHERYLQKLYGYNQELNYEDKEGEFRGTVIGILPNGAIQVNKLGKLKTYMNKELKFLT